MSGSVITAAWLPVIAALSPAGSRARLSIFIFHRVLAEPDSLRPGEPDAAHFAWQMELVASLFRVLPLCEAVERLRNGTLPARAACITFDDGYADNQEIALPILQRFGLPATFFIATGFLNGGRMFNDTVIEVLRRVPDGDLDWSREGLGRHRIESMQDRLAAIHAILQQIKYGSLAERRDWIEQITRCVPGKLPDDLMMQDWQVADLVEKGMDVGAHTVNHPILAREPLGDVKIEIEQSRDRLQRLIGSPVRAFAYPNGRRGGDFDEEHRDLVADLGFTAAVTTHAGAATRHVDPYQLPRFTPWDRTRGRFCYRLVRNLARRT